ncbi:MAG: WYL domain-containing protein [Eubacterium sp.]|nr:WYL domain-containing protein [Eubacterium sp.]
MDSFEPKKLALIRILHILEAYSDCDHPLTHDEIVKRLDALYGITVERKAIGRNISLLQEAGYDIETTKKGSYLNSRLFEDSELRLLSDGVLASQHVTAKHSKELIEKLATLSNRYFKSHIKNVHSINDWSKSENVALFYNIDIIDEAISKSRKIKFDYNKYGLDKKLHRSAIHVVSPYQMILHNQRYFLMAYQEKWQHMSFYRLDRITNIELLDDAATDLRSVDGYQNGIDYKRFSSALPYMFSDEPEKITFAIDGEWMIDQVVDWFGYDFKTEQKNDKIIVKVKASPYAMEYWAMQYLNSVEILSPASLREQIATNIINANKKYKGAKL